MKIIRFNDPLYSIRYLVLLGTWKEFRTYMRRRHPGIWKEIEGRMVDAGGLMTGEVFDKGRDATGARALHLIYLAPRKDVQAALLHECLHAALHTMEVIGHRVSAEESEPLAYYQDWLVRECRRRLGWKEL